MRDIMTITRWLCILMLILAGSSGAYANTPILLYHHFQPITSHMSKSMRRWSISPDKFKSQLDWVSSHGFHTITMEELVGHLKHHLPLPLKPIVLSFDDGWKEHYTIVYPLLKKYHYVGTFFIITDSVGHSAYMNWGQIHQLAADGMDIEAHTVTHPHLSALKHAEAQKEIVESKRVLEERLHKPVTVLAYPFGSYNEDTIAITKAAGFEAAATVGLNDGYIYRADDSYTLVRYALEGGDSLEYLAYAKGFDK